MRVIGGEFRSRKLKSPPGLETRPTPDRLRESLFNVLSARMPGAVFVDAYAGCGSVGIEALSRGAAQAVLIERSRQNVAIIRDNLDSLGAAARARVIHGGAGTYLGQIAADIYFLDPPYDRPAEYDTAINAIAESSAAASRPGVLVIAQHASRHPLADAYGTLEKYRTIQQGDNSLSFYKPAGKSDKMDEES